MKINDEKLEITHELQEKSNPVFNTAKMTLFQLAISGDEDAKKLIKDFNLTMEETQNSATQKMPEEAKIINTIIMETRFRTMHNMVLDSGCKTEIDMPCGYTPRALQISREGINFIGLDLPVVINEVSKTIPYMLNEDERKRVAFTGVDATNYDSLYNALQGKVNGPICITTEGLLMYFTNSEVNTLCQNVRRLLEQFGGCWITADPASALHFFGISKAILEDKVMEYLQFCVNVTQDKSDVVVGQNYITISLQNTEESIKNAIATFAQQGLKVERIPIAKYVPQLRMFEKINEKQHTAIMELYKNICYWKITLIDENKTDNVFTTTNKEINIEANVNGEILQISLNGRIDSISAPSLLAFFENIKDTKKFNTIICDCNDLEYISSAGLRILLIMKKAISGEVILQNINNMVKEILEQTGFDNILNIQ